MHKNADLDALAPAFYLKEIYKEAKIAADGIDRHVKNLANKFNIEILREVDGKFEEIITVDTASREQLGKFSGLRIDVVYDHHQSNNIEAPERYVDPSYPSCAEMLYDMYRKRPSKEGALLLLAGILSDTLWFRHGNRRTLKIFQELMDLYDFEMEEIREAVDLPVNFGEKISVLKGFQRLVYRTYGDRIVVATRVSANESIVATELLTFADIVFVGSSKKDDVRIIGRSKEVNLLDIFKELSEDFSCKYGGHKKAAGMSCSGDVEALLNAALQISGKYL